MTELVSPSSFFGEPGPHTELAQGAVEYRTPPNCPRITVSRFVPLDILLLARDGDRRSNQLQGQITLTKNRQPGGVGSESGQLLRNESAPNAILSATYGQITGYRPTTGTGVNPGTGGGSYSWL